MFEKTIRLSQFNSVKKFVEIAREKDYDIELLSEKYVVNAKSIMGVFSIDLTKPILVRAHCETPGEFQNQIAPFLVDKGNKS